MTGTSQLDQTYHFIMRCFVETGRAPHYTDIAREFSVSPDDGKRLNWQGFATRAIHAGQRPDPTTGAIMTPVYMSSTYVQESPGVLKDDYDYSRSANPTRKAFGYKGSPSAPVVRFQAAASISTDGIVGPGVRAAAKTYGVSLPGRPS